MSHDHDSAKMLARGRHCCVQYCGSCEQFHLHIGAFSVRLQPAVFFSVMRTMAAAQARIESGVPPEPPSLSVVPGGLSEGDRCEPPTPLGDSQRSMFSVVQPEA